MTLEELEELGFDRSESDGDGQISVRCSGCAALVINGVPCHEPGCPNQTHECNECCVLIPKRQHLCEDCANPEPFDDGLDRPDDID